MTSKKTFQDVRVKTLVQDLREEIAKLTSLADQLQKIDETRTLTPLDELPAALRQRRGILNVGQEEAALVCDVSMNTYRAVEREDGNPTLATLKAVGKGMNFRLWAEFL